MNAHTGTLVSPSTYATFSDEQKAEHVEVKRPLTVREQAKMKINKYAPCGCGSGRKFKFCCFRP